jgi:hypothetical protein
MARNIELGIKRVVTAKLRERGMSAQAADAVASKHATAALQVFNTALGLNLPTEESYEQAFEAVTQWAASLKP